MLEGCLNEDIGLGGERQVTKRPGFISAGVREIVLGLRLGGGVFFSFFSFFNKRSWRSMRSWLKSLAKTHCALKLLGGGGRKVALTVVVCGLVGWWFVVVVWFVVVCGGLCLCGGLW